MTNSFERSDPRRGVARRAGTLRTRIAPRRIKASDEAVLGTPSSDARGSPVEHESIVARPDELDRLHHSLADVTPESHPRTARLLASSTGKVAQKVIEEAGEVAIEAVKHHRRGIVRESADLLYHLVVLWHRAGIDPQGVLAELRFRADTLGIAEKLPKAGGDSRRRSVRNVKPTPEGKDHD